MSFFGFDTSLPKKPLAEEDLAVYTWGEDSYDGLGDALDEIGDDLNDVTFGGSEPVGKDFDFGATQLSNDLPKQVYSSNAPLSQPQSVRLSDVIQTLPAQPHRPDIRQPPTQPVTDSLGALWKIQNSATQRHTQNQSLSQVDLWGSQEQLDLQAKFSPFDELPVQAMPGSQHQNRVRTLQEIEAELRASHQHQRLHQSPIQPPIAPPNHAVYQSPQYGHTVPARHAQQLQHEQQPSFIDQGQLAMGQLERMLQAQHISEHLPDPRLRGPSPAQVLQQMGHLPPEQLFQAQLHRQQQYGRPSSMDLMNGQGHQGHMDPRLAGIPPEILAAAGLAAPGFLPGGMPQIGEGLRHDVPVHRASPGLDPARRVALDNEATRKIMEAERAEAKRRRKAAKISKMSRYNDLMTQSDKDFITRIQVSQLVTEDPYNEDFYAQVYSSFVRSRMGPTAQTQKSILRLAGGAGVGVGIPGHRGAGRRENAMARMQNQVERIVKNAQARQKDVSAANLQGALGKVSGRSYKAAPRQMLQVDTNGTKPSPSLASASPAIASQEHRDQLTQAAGKLGREAMNVADPGVAVARQPALTRRQVQVAIERLYDSLLAMEQNNRDAPAPEDELLRSGWEAKHAALLDELWTRSMIMVPVETSDPHPFISILSLHKGKRLVPRLVRLLPDDKVMLLLVLFIRCFYQLDVVRNAHVLDLIQEQGSTKWKDVSAETDAALMILPTITGLLGNASVRLLAGLLNILLGTGVFAVLQIVKSQPGIALLTAFMSRVDHLKHNGDDGATEEDWDRWDNAFDSLLTLLQGSILLIFPSQRLQSAIRAGFTIPNLDLADQIAWQFLAALAAIGTQPQQMSIVAQVRDMILEVVQTVHNNWVPDPNDAALKLANVNILLNAIGLDHTMLIAS